MRRARSPVNRHEQSSTNRARRARLLVWFLTCVTDDARVPRTGFLRRYKAALSKNQDAILEAADAVVTACANCHEAYRDKGGLGGQVAACCVK
jgi:cytochrome c553